MTTESKDLTLYGIETQLLELLAFREDVESDPDASPAEIAESLKACDESIEAYVRAEVEKADGIAEYLNECSARAAVLREESKRLAQWAGLWAARRDRLERVVVSVMQHVKRLKIEGHRSSLAVRKNPPSVEIRQPDLVPAAYRKLTVRMSVDLYERLAAHLLKNDQGGVLFAELLEARSTAAEEVSKSKVSEELKAGVGVPGCQLVTDRVRLEVK